MKLDPRSSALPHLAWVYPGSLADELYAAQHLDTTRELREMGWRVTMVAAGPAGRRCVRGVEVLCTPMPKIYFLRQLVFHMKAVRLVMRLQTTPDIVLFHQPSLPWLLPLRFARHLMGKRRPLLVMDTRTVHMPPRDKEGWKGRVRRMFLQLVSRAANDWADGQTAITQRMAQTVSIPSHQLWGVWPSGVNLDQFASAQVTRRWPLNGEPIHVIYIGTLHYERNLMTLCQAVERANAEGMSFILSLVGDGTERMDLERFAGQTAGRIRVLPPIPHDQVPGLLAQAHIGALPFPDEEKFRVSSPIKLFEYMASGLAILATRVVCHTDVVDDGEYAFWAEDADLPGLLAALRLTWQARASLPKMGREAAKAAAGWTWQESARKLKVALEHGLARYQ